MTRRPPAYVWVLPALLGGFLGGVILARWWGGAAGGVWGGLLGLGVAALLQRPWPAVARWVLAAALLLAGLSLLVVAAGFLAAVLELTRAASQGSG